jgi:hypothetical protein
MVEIVRLAAPHQFGHKSIKFVTRMEFTGSGRPSRISGRGTERAQPFFEN